MRRGLLVVVGLASAALVACHRGDRGAPSAEDRAADFFDEAGPFTAIADTDVPEASLLRDLAYGAEPRQKLDVYVPKTLDRAQAKAPIVLLVHGGGWRNGDKGHRRLVVEKVHALAPRGVVFASTNYRLMTPIDVGAQASDIAHALAYVQAHAPEWGADPARVVLMGHSAGAHLALLVTADQALRQAAGAEPAMATVSLDSGAIDVPATMTHRHFKLHDDAFGTDKLAWERLSPHHRLSANVAPLLVVCAENRLDACPQGRRFVAKARELGGVAELMPVPLSHGEINGEVGKPGPYTAGIFAFLARAGVRELAAVSGAPP